MLSGQQLRDPIACDSSSLHEDDGPISQSICLHEEGFILNYRDMLVDDYAKHTAPQNQHFTTATRKPSFLFANGRKYIEEVYHSVYPGVLPMGPTEQIEKTYVTIFYWIEIAFLVQVSWAMLKLQSTSGILEKI